jgi:hypothetical protein
MPQPKDLSRSHVALEQDATLIAVIEMGPRELARGRHRVGSRTRELGSFRNLDADDAVRSVITCVS